LYEDYKLENFRQIFVIEERQFGNKVEKTVPIRDEEEERKRKRCK
jgi:hypothetical protein